MIPETEIARLVFGLLRGLRRTQEPDVWVRKDVIELASSFSTIKAEGMNFTNVVTDTNPRRQLQSTPRRTMRREGHQLIHIETETAIAICVEWLARHPHVIPSPQK